MAKDMGITHPDWLRGMHICGVFDTRPACRNMALHTLDTPFCVTPRARDRRQSESSRVLRRAYNPSSSVWRPRGSRGKGEEEPASKRSRHHALERASGQQRQHQHARRRRGEAGCTAISSLDSVALQHSSSGARLSVSGASSLPDLKNIIIVHFAIFFVVVLSIACLPPCCCA